MKKFKKLVNLFMVMMLISAFSITKVSAGGIEVLTLNLLTDTNVVAGNAIKLEAQINQELKENTYLTYEFSNGVDGFGGNFEYDKENEKYTCIHYIDETVAPGNYTLKSLSVQGEMTSQSLKIDNFNIAFHVENQQYEESRPKITGITGMEKEYKTNEVIKLKLDVESTYELDESAIVIFRNGSKTIEMKLKLEETSYTGEVTIPKGVAGEWKLSDILLSSSHEYIYYSVSDSYKEMAKDMRFTIEELSEPSDDTSKEEQTNKTISQEAIQESINKIEQQSQVVVNMENATIVPKDILEAAKGKNVDVTFKMDGYSWVINGTNITNVQDINLEVKFGLNNIPNKLKTEKALNNPYQEISLTHEGEFGFKANLQMLVDEKYAGMSANLYYFTENGLEYMCNSIIDKDGFVSLDFSHASDYLLIMKEKEKSINVDDTHQNKQETQNPVNTSDASKVLYLDGLLGISGLAMLKILKKKEN